MRVTTEKKVSAVFCAVIMALLFAAAAAILLLSTLRPHGGELAAIGVSVLCSLVLIAGVIAAAVQRVRELGSGEEEEAKKY